MKERQAFLEAVKKKLLMKRSELAKSVAAHSEEKVSDKQIKDVGDEALSLSMEKLTSTLQMTERDELKNIDDALARLTRGEYGICVDCGSHISDKRLEASPYSARCIVCQEALEG